MSSTHRKRCATPGRNQYREASASRAKRSLEDQDAVEVVCRLTPYYGPTPCLAVAEENIIRCIPPPTLQKRDGTPYQSKDFEFGYVFDESDRQQVVFERCAVDLIEHLLKGKNGLLFTYGVTGSGKTYTMTGKPTPEETGLLPRTLDVVFNSIDNKVDRCVFYPNGRNGFGIRPKMEATLARRQAEMERLQVSSEIEQRYMERLVVPGYNDNYVCSVFVSYVEIYNNYCYDLLETKNTLTKREIRLDINNIVYVDGAREVEVDNSDEALELFCKGEERRRTSDTILNKESSRSHSVFTIRLVMAPFDSTSYSVYPDSDPNRIVVSQLSLVDLAGSERAKRTQNVGDRLAEAASINKSLMVLRQCIEKLRRNQRSALHETVPYRDAKLTMLFKNFFEGAGKVRMIICANPKPSDFEENLNVLSFAEESQSVRVARADDRLETDTGPRPPVPRRFFSRWNMEVDNIVTPASLLPSSTRLFTEFAIKDYNDSTSISILKDRCLALSQLTSDEHHGIAAEMRNGEITLRNALCVADYAKVELDELRARLEKDADQIASYSAENKKLKRELLSLRERLSRYEVQDEEIITAEENLRRSVKEERSRARKQDQKLKVIQDICDAPSPSFAQIRSKFAMAAETPSYATITPQKRAVTTASSNQVASSSRQPRPVKQDPGTPVSGPGFFNPKYHRRSKSAPRVLDHQPTNRVPTGGILRVKVPNNARHVTKPEAHQLQKSSDYILTHQEVDREGNISTSVVKGECIPTAGGGTAVLFNDVEQVSHKSPGRVLRPTQRGNT
nr:Kinesin domain containing protein [Haemonchus contortus]